MRLGWLVAGAVLAAAGASAAEPPRVVTTFPAAGAKIPPSLAELTVRYDRPMAASWSFTTGGEKAFPSVEGPPTLSDDRRTITLPVRLTPNSSYVVWLNSGRYNNFRDEQGQPATPYRLAFTTTD